MHELGCKCLDDVYDMSWREFTLRKLGFLRLQKLEWERTRCASYYSLVATGAIDTKKLSIERFMPLGESKPKLTNSMIKALEEAQNNYGK